MVWALLDEIGISVFATKTRVKHAELSKYGSQGEERCIPVDVLLDAEIMRGNPMVTRLLADLQGYDLVPKTRAMDGGATVDKVLRSVKESGDVASAYLTAMADGKMDAADRQVLCREIDEAVTILMDIRRGL